MLPQPSTVERFLTSLHQSLIALPLAVRALLIPLTVAHLLGTSTRSLPLQVVLYLLCLPLWYTLRKLLLGHISSLQAKRLGAALVPRVKGRWPFNVDIIVSWAKNKQEDVARTLFLMERAYGLTYNTRVLGEDQIVTSDPAVFKQVLVNDFDNFVKGPKFRRRARGFLGDGIFNSDGERWKFHRTLTRPFFHPNHVSPDKFVPLIRRTLQSMPLETSGNSKPFDAQALFAELSLQQSLMWLCGVDLAETDVSQGADWVKARDGLQLAMRTAESVVARRLKVGAIWPLFELKGDPLKEPMKTINTFMDVLIDEAVQRREKRKNGASAEDLHLIDKLVEATDDRRLIRDQLINILMAAKDTSTGMMTFFTYIIALMPNIASKLRQEISDVVGMDGAITKDALRDLTFCRAFINETLRLFPPVPLNIRRTTNPTLLPSATIDGKPLFMPAGTSIVLASVVMHRSKAIWGDDALEFKPERWLDGLSDQQREAYVSFSAGPRMCAGQPMALAVAHTFLILLFQHLHKTQATLVLAPDAQPADSVIPPQWLTHGDGRLREGRDRAWFISDVTASIKGGLWLRLQQEQGRGE